MEKPKQIVKPNLANLTKVCQQYIDFIGDSSSYHEDNDYDEYIFETAMETIFGEDVWKYVRGQPAESKSTENEKEESWLR